MMAGLAGHVWTFGELFDTVLGKATQNWDAAAERLTALRGTHPDGVRRATGWFERLRPAGQDR